MVPVAQILNNVFSDTVPGPTCINWDVPDKPDEVVVSVELVALEAGVCPFDGSQIIWCDKLLDARMLHLDGTKWRGLDSGYYFWDSS
jgi:hypothetical protein